MRYRIPTISPRDEDLPYPRRKGDSMQKLNWVPLLGASLLLLASSVASFADGVDSKADSTGPPPTLLSNQLVVPEVGTEAINGLAYVPIAGQPGFPTNGSILYSLVSDGIVTCPLRLTCVTENGSTKLDGFTIVPGDVVLTENGKITDVIRFSQGANGASAEFIFSDSEGAPSVSEPSSVLLLGGGLLGIAGALRRKLLA
jgi:hypothetical protein